MKKPSNMVYSMISAIFLLLVVGLAVFVGAREAQVSADLASRGVTTEAMVVAVEQKGGFEPSSSVVTWTDVTVAFTNAQGTPVRATRGGSESTKVGDRLRIVYDPRDPTHASWDTAVDEGPVAWVYAVIFLAISLALLVVALRDARRRRRGAGENAVTSANG